jgi:hypothetical protein
MQQRVYLDTSVIGGCFDEEFSLWSIKLFEDFQNGKKIAVISDLTRRELEFAPKEVKNVIASINEANIENVFFTKDAEQLALQYLKNGVVGKKHIADAQHIAIATIERVDVLVSWNFKQIVNLDRIHGFNAVNLMLGYAILEIRNPREVIYEKDI